MLRLPEKLWRYLLDAGMGLLISFSLAYPALRVLSLEQELRYVLALLMLFALLLPLIGRLKPLPRLAASLAFAGLFLLWALQGGLMQALENLLGSLISMRPANHVMTLYADRMLAFGALMLALFARLLLQGEASFSAPMLLSSALMLWFSGARQHVEDFIPALISMPLLFAYAGLQQEPPPKSLASQPTGMKAFLRAVPITALIIVMALALTPAQRSTAPALEKQADRLRQYINDHFFFTSSRENFSLASEGYQPMGGDGLGGRPAISNVPVLQVETERKVYLRGTMLDLYDGRQWHDSLSNERYGFTAARFAGLRDDLLNARLPEEGLRLPQLPLTVSLLNQLPSTLFTPQRLRNLLPGEGMVPYLNASSEVFITRNLEPGDSYSLRYEPYVAGTPDTDALASRLRGHQDPAFDSLPDNYLQMPAHLAPGGILEDLAFRIAGDEQDSYRKAMLVRAYLRDNYSYSLDVVDPPRNLDFAQHFLFDRREGYCTYFATAMTLLCRELGLPSRYVEGFVALPNEDGSPSILSGQQAHAWTEVYIPALGWVTFDATATTGELPPPPRESEGPPEGSPEPETSPEPSPEPEEQEGEAPQDEPTERPEPSPSPSEAPEKQEGEQIDQRGASRGAGWLWWLLIAALIGLFVWRLYQSEPQRLAAKAKSPSLQLLIYWQAYALLMHVAGKSAKESETLIEYFERSAPGDEALRRFGEALSAELYGRREAEPEEALAARLCYLGARQGLAMPRRAWAAIIRTLRDILHHIRALPGRVWSIIKK